MAICKRGYDQATQHMGVASHLFYWWYLYIYVLQIYYKDIISNVNMFNLKTDFFQEGMGPSKLFAFNGINARNTLGDANVRQVVSDKSSNVYLFGGSFPSVNFERAKC